MQNWLASGSKGKLAVNRGVRENFALAPEAVLCQTRCEGLSFGDFRHFQRRREALERRREDRVGFGGAAGRLVEFGERERRAQFEAARPLLFRDGDRGQEGIVTLPTKSASGL